jgi:hypothetical protein
MCSPPPGWFRKKRGLALPFTDNRRIGGEPPSDRGLFCGCDRIGGAAGAFVDKLEPEQAASLVRLRLTGRRAGCAATLGPVDTQLEETTMALYNILIVGRNPSNAAELDNAISAIDGLKSALVDATGEYVSIVVETDLGPDQVLAMVGKVVGPFACFVYLQTVLREPEPPVLYHYVMVYHYDENEEWEDRWEEKLRKEFGEAFQLTHTRIGALGVMTLHLTSYLTRSNLLGRLEKVGRGVCDNVRLYTFEAMDEIAPKVVAPQSTVKPRGIRKAPGRS